MKIVLIGANGQLGSDLVKALRGFDVVGLTHADLEVCDGEAVRKMVGGLRPDLVINTSAFHRVDECEDAPEKALAVNAVAVRELARICAAAGCALVHMSTDYVFGGSPRQPEEPYDEDDAPSPLNVYGVSKLAGEYFVRYLCPKHFLVRSTGLYGVVGSSGKGGNFVETMVRLAREGKPIRVVDDQVLTPTYTRELAAKIAELVQTDAYGLYHVTNSGRCSWYEFAGRIFELMGLTPDFGPTTTAAVGAKARRPAYSVLAHRNLLQRGFADLSPWPQALEAYLKEKHHI
jgi:dTDP-4-dehydrorhamnose reductase